MGMVYEQQTTEETRLIQQINYFLQNRATIAKTWPERRLLGGVIRKVIQRLRVERGAV